MFNVTLYRRRPATKFIVMSEVYGQLKQKMNTLTFRLGFV